MQFNNKYKKINHLLWIKNTFCFLIVSLSSSFHRNYKKNVNIWVVFTKSKTVDSASVFKTQSAHGTIQMSEYGENDQ